jgi:UDP-N-acetylmuramoyl-L-alanyl-D-glutamate--2,6-diaminopimelate ligase
VKLADAIREIDIVSAEGRVDVDVGSITYDSRKVVDGGVFVAIKGHKSDGTDFVDAAVNNGARVIVSEGYAGPYAAGVTYIEARDARDAMGLMASAIYGNPSRKLKLVGITGTNGKTTTSYLVKAGIEACGHKAGVIGTISYQVGERELPAPNTTPESADLQMYFSEMLKAGADHAVVEVSSHSVSLKRTVGSDFMVRVFTNFSRDHLDYHGDMDTYFGEKLKFFKDPGGVSVVNADDPKGDEVAKGSSGCALNYAIDARAGVRGRDLELMPGGLRMKVVTPVGEVVVESPLVGRHNAYNILAAIAACICLDLPLVQAAKGIASLKDIPGRFERVEAGQDFTVIVDYAHTDDALVIATRAAREFTSGRLITLFGCGGDRDRGKRPRMGEAAARMSDIVVVTSDNPRTEDPESILSEVLEGVRSESSKRVGENCFAILDRAEAIRYAIGLAHPGDTVLLAGKGHEVYQIIGTKKIHFDDREVARQAVVEIVSR